MQPIEWAYESTPNTPLVVNTRFVVATTQASVFAPAQQTIRVRSGQGNVGDVDNAIHFLTGPASGSWSDGVTSDRLLAAQNGPAAFIVAPQTGWITPSGFADPLAKYVSTAASPSTSPTALFSTNFTVNPPFDPSRNAISYNIACAARSQFGSEPSPGVFQAGLYVNGHPDTVGVIQDSITFNSNRLLHSPLVEGQNTLAFYDVRAPFFPNAGIMYSLLYTIYPPISMSLDPSETTVLPGGMVSLTAALRNTSDTRKVFTLTGGTITPAGAFTAPQTAGDVIVTVTSLFDSSISASATIHVANAPCPADFNADGFVNPDDLSDFVTCFFLQIQLPGSCAGADFNSDGFVNPDDLADFITTFFLAVQFGC
jgi:hypothetical protein